MVIFARRPKAVNATGQCSKCHQTTAFKREDFGIGAYEYWGARGTHHDYQWVSQCCEAQPEGELDVNEPEYPDRRGEY